MLNVLRVSSLSMEQSEFFAALSNANNSEFIISQVFLPSSLIKSDVWEWVQ